MADPMRLGRYEIRRQIGKGAMGIVYEAFDTQIERSVAIKVIREGDLDAAQVAELRSRLRREAQATGRLNHPGIVAIYDYGEASTRGDGQADVAFIAMELVAGRELKQCFDARERFAPADIERIMCAILAALKHAHDHGVTHRDIKPSNVILLPDGRVKVADFGVARIEASELTQAGTMLGTPMYMSPEQILGQAVDGRSDLFSCGILLYQFLTGERPFTGSITTVMQKVLNEEPEPPTRRNSALPAAWDGVVSRALAKDPADRFQRADEFAAAIRSATALSLDDTTVLLPPTQAAAPQPPRRTAARVAWGAAALGAVGIGVALWWPGSKPAPPAVIALAPAASAPGAAPAAAQAPAPPPSSPTMVTHTGAEPAVSAMVAATPATPPAVGVARPASTAAPERSPSRPVDVRPAAREPAPPPIVPAPDPKSEWARNMARVDATRGALTAGSAMALLLDVQRATDRQLLDEFDAAVGQMRAHSALAMGVFDGRLVMQWQQGAPTARDATEVTVMRCASRRAVACGAVVVDGEFRKRAFMEAARALGGRTAASVREAALARSTEVLQDLRRPLAVPVAPASAAAQSVAAVPAVPAASAAPAQASAAPSRAVAEWREAVARLQAGRGRLGLASALATLLQAQTPAELDVLQRLETAAKRLRWNSALAIGVKNGHLLFAHAAAGRKAEWAQESALAACGRLVQGDCAVVMADGSYIDAGLIEVAARLGGRSQAVVREGFISFVQRRLDKVL